MHPQVARVARRVRRALDDVLPPTENDQAQTRDPTTSPYFVWNVDGDHDADGKPAFHIVGDIALVQGIAPHDATVALELGDGTDSLRSLPIEHRFPPPTGPRTKSGFELTLDSATTAGTTHARLVINSEPSDWVALPSLPSPAGMPGTERIESCPACGADELAPTGRRQQLGMQTCRQCGLVMTTPRPAEDKTLMRYSERYFEDEYLPSQQMTSSLRDHIDAILAHVEPARKFGDTLFELGVGGGNLLTRAREKGWMVSGTDVNPASVQHSNAAGLNVRHENADHATDLDGSYAAIISEMSIEHVRHPDHFCQLASNALIPGGRLVIYTVSAEGDSFMRAGMASPLVGPAEHLFLFSAGSLTSMCENAGLRVETLWRNETADEIGIVASKRLDVGNPATP